MCASARAGDCASCSSGSEPTMRAGSTPTSPRWRGTHGLRAIGIKTYQQRGEGTDFKQLSEYRVGNSVRHIDWRATLRLGKPIVREFQDERDQCVILLVDCGRRMRADDRLGAIGTTHFDQVLNAIILLSYVALREG